jgi:hypothetical protein
VHTTIVHSCMHKQWPLHKHQSLEADQVQLLLVEDVLQLYNYTTMYLNSVAHSHRPYTVFVYTLLIHYSTKSSLQSCAASWMSPTWNWSSAKRMWPPLSAHGTTWHVSYFTTTAMRHTLMPTVQLLTARVCSASSRLCCWYNIDTHSELSMLPCSVSAHVHHCVD